MFTIVIVLMVLPVYPYVKTYQIVHFNMSSLLQANYASIEL